MVYRCLSCFGTPRMDPLDEVVHPASNEGGFLDLRTGEVFPAFMTDAARV